MSVNNSYISLDWSRLGSVPKDDDFAAYLFDEIDDEADWVQMVPFGEQIDEYYFESWNGLMTFNDWFREQKSAMDQTFVKQFSALFMDVGLLHTDAFAPAPIKQELDFPSDWLLASLPPAVVAELAARAESIDLEQTAREFQSAVDKAPCDMVPDGQSIADWVAALRDGLRASANAGHGIVMGAA